MSNVRIGVFESETLDDAPASRTKGNTELMPGGQEAANGRPIHLLIVSNTSTSKSISGGDRDWVNLINALGPDRLRVTWVGIDNSEALRTYLDPSLKIRFLNVSFEPFYEVFHQSMYRRRSVATWARIIGAHLLGMRRPAVRLRGIMRSDPPDVVVSNTSVVWLGAAYALLTRIPHVWSVKEFLDPTVAACRNFARLIEKLSNRVVVPSQAMAAIFKPGVRVLHDGNDLLTIRKSTEGLDRSDLLGSLGLPATQPVIVQTGALSWAKGQHLTAQACAKIASEGRGPCSILFLGSGNQTEKDNLCGILGSAPAEWRNSIRFVEFGPGEFSYLSTADIVVHPSVLPDPYPNAIREALILGKPVIGSEVGGIPELITNDVTGVLIKSNDADALSLALKRLLDSPEERARMGSNAWQFAGQHLDINVCQQGFYELLLKLLNCELNDTQKVPSLSN